LGKRSRDLLNKFGFEIFFGEDATTVKELLETIPKEELKNKKFLFPRGNRSLRVVPETLENIAEIIETIVYRTHKLKRTNQDCLK
jgi:uroporphyrinogen-III synthase